MVDDSKRQEMLDKSQDKILARKRLEKLQEDSEWNILEQILQEIESTFLVSKEKTPSNEKLVEMMAAEINAKYFDDLELKSLLHEALPSRVSISKWRKKKGWEEAVWSKVRSTGLFTQQKRQRIIDSLFEQATDGNTNAAKIWLTLSGDYQEKGNQTSEVVDQFREINSIIHGNKK